MRDKIEIQHNIARATLFIFVLIMLMAGNGYGWTGALGNIEPKKIAITTLESRIPFIENRGQIADNQVRFYSKASGVRTYVTSPGEIIYRVSSSRETSSGAIITTNVKFPTKIPKTPSEPERSYLIRERFLGSRYVSVEGVEKAEGKTNYFIGNDCKNWKRNVALYNAISLGEVYRNIEVKLIHRNNCIEKVITVNPEGLVSDLRIQLEGASSTSIGEGGKLEAETPAGTIRFTKPVAHQEIGGRRVEVPVAYALIPEGPNIYGFTVDNYDKNLPLIIDPIVEFTTCFGGSDQKEGASGVALDSEGNIYITGYTYSVDFPTVNPIQQKLSDMTSYDVFVTKMNPSGDRIIYSTYLIGLFEDYGRAIAVDIQGNAYVTGQTRSQDFPIKGGLQISFDYSHGSCLYGFITKINSDGNDLVFSTLLGGPTYEFDNNPTAISVDRLGNIYVAGGTSSPEFPTKNPIQGNYGGGTSDAFITKINPSGDSIIYSTFLGGRHCDGVSALTVDGSGNVYVAGLAMSQDFPTKNALQPQIGDLNPDADWGDSFIAKINSAGDDLIFSTFLGGYGTDYILGMTVDDAGYIYVTGYTDSINFPTKNPIQVLWGFLRNPYGWWISDAFVSKISPDGKELVYSTFWGGAAGEDAYAIALDKSGNVFIVGDTESNDFVLKNSLLELVYGYVGAFITKFNSSGNGVLYSTLFGGGTGISGVAVDDNGNLVVIGLLGGYPRCNNFFIPNGYVGNWHGPFVAKITDSPADENMKLLIMQNLGSGKGTITVQPSGFKCETLFCSHEYPKGTNVTLYAEAAQDYDFGGWLVECSGMAKSCKVSLEEDKNVIVLFVSRTLSLTFPNLEETWIAGSTYTIRWSYTGNPGTYVKIELLKGGVVNRTIASRVSISSGSYNWKIPSDQTPGRDYQIRVTSTSNSSYTDTSDSSFTIGGPPSPPINIQASDGTYMDKVKVTWTASPEATSYTIYRATSNSRRATKVTVGTTSDTTYDDTTASIMKTYYYYITATNSYGTSGYSAYDTGYRSDGRPSVPTNVQASDGTYTDRVRITWEASTWATSYTVYRATSTSRRATKVAMGTTADTTHDDTTASVGVIYYYYVTATNSYGTSGFSAYNTGYR